MGYIEQVFELGQEGSKVSQREFYDCLRPKLFDYAMRMTGLEPDAEQIVDEVARELLQMAFVTTDVRSEIFHIFKLVRQRGLASWGGETEKLVNPAYQVSRDEDLPRMERILRTLAPSPREAVLLQHRYAFATSEIAALMQLSEEEVQTHLLKGNQRLGIIEKEHAEQLQRLLDFPISDRPKEATVALSQVIRGVKKTDGKKWKLVIFLIFLFLGVIAVSAYFALRILN